MKNSLGRFKELWVGDFEFRVRDGDRPHAMVCAVFREVWTGRTIRLWCEELYALKEAPFDVGSESCFIAYNAIAEYSCFLHLGWKLPRNLIDFYPEYLNISNGYKRPFGGKKSLLSAMAWFGVKGIEQAEKDSMIDLILSKEKYDNEEKQKILAYCESDVDALLAIFPKLTQHKRFDVRFALRRGRFMRVMAQLDYNGIPVDFPTYEKLVRNWDDLKNELIAEVDKDYGVYVNGKFKRSLFEDYLKGLEALDNWPRTKGTENRPPVISTSNATFSEMKRLHPELVPLQLLRKTLDELKLNKIQIGSDHRNRYPIFPFGSKTARNTPSNSQFIFGPAKWVRFLIKPEPGMALAYIDWAQQEFGIAAALSKDPAMMHAYQSADPYIEFAKMAKRWREDAPPREKDRIRTLFKRTALGLLFMITKYGLSRQLGISLEEAQGLIDLHKKVFPKYWEWSDGVYDYAILSGEIHTVFGWYLHVTKGTRESTIRNFPMQGNGSEMMRHASWLVYKKGIKLCATIHDALLIEAPAGEIDEAIRVTQECMREASELILPGFPLKSEAERFIYPERFVDDDGLELWNKLQQLLAKRS